MGPQAPPGHLSAEGSHSMPNPPSTPPPAPKAVSSCPCGSPCLRQPCPCFRPTRNIQGLRIDAVDQLDEGSSRLVQGPTARIAPSAQPPAPGQSCFKQHSPVTPIPVRNEISKGGDFTGSNIFPGPSPYLPRFSSRAAGLQVHFGGDGGRALSQTASPPPDRISAPRLLL